MNRSRAVPKLAAAGRELWQIFRDVCDPYRPELYYMRGPGPKWTAAHAPVVTHEAAQVGAAAKAA